MGREYCCERNIMYDESRWVITANSISFDVILENIKFCPYCGRKLSTATVDSVAAKLIHDMEKELSDLRNKIADHVKEYHRM